ncbi:MAG: SpoVG family protein [candidate division FCPU426 bacterium]
MQIETQSTPVYSSVRITLTHRDSLRAMASCLVGGAMFVNGMRVVEGKNGLFVAMPSRKNAAGEYQDVAFPCSKEMRDQLQRVILDEFEKANKQAMTQVPATA